MARLNQQRRTRKDILQAASRLMRQGLSPSMEDVAEEAAVSRATAYRYFPNVEAVLLEAPLDGSVPDPDELFAGDESTDPVERLDRAERALHDMCYKNEEQLRLLLAHAVVAPNGGSSPSRQNRRTLLIEAALAPLKPRLGQATYKKLCAALALIFGTESMVVFRDVVPLQKDSARDVKAWAISALVRAALKE